MMFLLVFLGVVGGGVVLWTVKKTWSWSRNAKNNNTTNSHIHGNNSHISGNLSNLKKNQRFTNALHAQGVQPTVISVQV
jgi:hypothetical protein